MRSKVTLQGIAAPRAVDAQDARARGPRDAEVRVRLAVCRDVDGRRSPPGAPSSARVREHVVPRGQERAEGGGVPAAWTERTSPAAVVCTDTRASAGTSSPGPTGGAPSPRRSARGGYRRRRPAAPRSARARSRGSRSPAARRRGGRARSVAFAPARARSHCPPRRCVVSVQVLPLTPSIAPSVDVIA